MYRFLRVSHLHFKVSICGTLSYVEVVPIPTHSANMELVAIFPNIYLVFNSLSSNLASEIYLDNFNITNVLRLPRQRNTLVI